MYDDAFSSLVGRRIAKVYRNETKDHLRFVVADSSGGEVHFEMVGDCCSSSWIEHMSGVCFLIGAIIAEVTPGTEVETIDNHPEHDCLRFYNYNIRTDKGICAVEMRNSSNGYYGGSIDLAADCTCTAAIEVTDDF